MIVTTDELFIRGSYHRVAPQTPEVLKLSNATASFITDAAPSVHRQITLYPLMRH